MAKKLAAQKLEIGFGDLRNLFAAFQAVASAQTTSARVDAIVAFADVFAKVTPMTWDDQVAAFVAGWNASPGIHAFVVGLIDTLLTQPSDIELEAYVTEDMRAEFNLAGIDPGTILAVAKILADIIRLFGG